MLSRALTELGIYPAVDPLDSSSRMMDPNIVGEKYINLYKIDITQLQEEFKNYYKITNHYKILLPFWVWMNFLKMINLQLLEQEKFKDSFHNHSS